MKKQIANRKNSERRHLNEVITDYSKLEFVIISLKIQLDQIKKKIKRQALGTKKIKLCFLNISQLKFIQKSETCSLSLDSLLSSTRQHSIEGEAGSLTSLATHLGRP